MDHDSAPDELNKEKLQINKLEEIENLQKMIFSSNSTSTSTSNSSSSINETKSTSTKLIDHGQFLHDFKESNISASEIVPLYFLKHHSTKDDSESPFISNTIPVITNITRKDQDKIEITRVHLYKDYYNKKPYCTEKILIKRKPKNDSDDVFISFFEDKMKKEITSITAGGSYSRVVKFKLYRNPNEILFFQNIFYYRFIAETYFYYRYLNKIPPKKDFDITNMKYNEFLKNLF